MRDVVNAFHEGGSTMYLVLLFALAAHGAALAGAAAGGFSRAERGKLFGAMALGLGLIALAIGWLGYRHGMSMGRAAVASVSPDLREQLLAQCELEAGRNLTFGLYALVIPGVLGAIMLVRAATLPPTRDPALPPEKH
ncbi:MAG TPA: hypothetical protein VFF06_34140 [Polyangia bacterium]|nr:hypothetical protein [Polyangia bacterium]